MFIQTLEISNVRNLRRVCLAKLDVINIFYGQNGSGKTSLLEAIYLLGLGRSFRTRSFKSVILGEEEASVVFCTALNPASSQLIPIGVQRSRQSSPEIRIYGEKAGSIAQLAALLPMQLINSAAFTLLEGPPNFRRQFIDWGVFHVEHTFNTVWQNARRCLKHRNSLLRHGKIHESELEIWTREFAQAATSIDQHRNAYVGQLSGVFNDLVVQIMDLDDVQLEYFCGWNASQGLDKVLNECQHQDRRQGFTSFGPHKADLRIKRDNRLATETLSRGQEKLLICCLKLAQATLFESTTGRKCVFLIDDLPAELDSANIRIICEYLTEIHCQVFITCIDRAHLLQQWGCTEPGSSWFHVEHGEISPV